MLDFYFKLRRDHRKNLLWSEWCCLWVGRRWKPILCYILKKDEKRIHAFKIQKYATELEGCNKQNYQYVNLFLIRIFLNYMNFSEFFHWSIIWIQCESIMSMTQKKLHVFNSM